MTKKIKGQKARGNKLGWICVLALAAWSLVLSGGCRRTSHNGAIDGFWQLERIEYFEEGKPEETVECEGLYFGINLELMQLLKPSPVATGVISYDKSEKRLGVDFRTNPSEKVLREFGVMENPVVFEVEAVNSRRLVLKTASSRVYCRRY